MRLTTKIRYGTRAIIDICIHSLDGPVMAKDIAARTCVSKKYLDALLRELKISGLVRSIRGPGGGFVLAKDPESITMGDVVRALEGDLLVADCLSSPDICEDSEYCATILLWKEISSILGDYLDSLTLADMSARQSVLDREKNNEKRQVDSR